MRNHIRYLKASPEVIRRVITKTTETAERQECKSRLINGAEKAHWVSRRWERATANFKDMKKLTAVLAVWRQLVFW